MVELPAFTFQDPGLLLDDELQLILSGHLEADPIRGFVPEYRFEMRRTNIWRPVGYISLRIGYNDFLCLYAGHIGYRVEPEYRGHHYASRSVRLLLPFAKAHGISPLWITCNPDNTASRRSCEYAGGVFVEIVPLPRDCEMYLEGERFKCRYRFDL